MTYNYLSASSLRVGAQGAVQLGPSDSGSVLRLQSGCWLGPLSSEGSYGARGHASPMVLSLSCGLKASGPHHSGLSTGSSNILTTRQAASSRVRDPKERARRKLSASYDLVSEDTPHRFCHLVLTRSGSPSQPTLPGRGTES